jgi:hypothetical protein
MENSNGLEVFVNFIKQVPEGISNFDDFALLDQLSQNKVDRDLVITLLADSIINI